MASDQLGTAALHLGHALFLTSLIAAMISFHNIIARYMFSLGREGVLPRAFGRTVPGTGAPKDGSLAQSVVGLVVILLYAVAGWDPLVQLFFWGGTGGGIGVLLLITLTSIAVIGYFARHHEGETPGTARRAGHRHDPAADHVVPDAAQHRDAVRRRPGHQAARWVVPTAFGWSRWPA